MDRYTEPMAPQQSSRPAIPSNLARLAEIAKSLPETTSVDIEAWGGESAFKVRKKVFLYATPSGTTICLKLPLSEAQALVAGDESVTPMKFNLGKHGWIEAQLRPDEQDEARWREVAEWIRTSYSLVGPKSLVKLMDNPTD